MKVRVLDEVVPNPGESSVFLDLAIALAAVGALQLVAEAPERDGLSPRLRSWLGGARARQVQGFFAVRARSLRWTREVDLVRGPSNFEVDPIKVGPEDAGWMRLPVQVYVENSRNDWGFVKKAIPAAWRSAFAAAERRDSFVPVGGGITEMLQIARDVHASDARLCRRSWFLFDSDGPAGAPSRAARELSDTLTRLGIPFHRLRRRAIENYVPRRQRREWVHRDPDFVAERVAWMDAFDALADTDRWAFPMKSGEAHRPPPLDSRLPPDPASRRAKGATPLSDVWRNAAWAVPERDLNLDGSRPERIDMANSLLAMVA